MDTTKTFACALVALLLGASACSTGDETEAQIAELSARIVELETEIAQRPLPTSGAVTSSELRTCISAVLSNIESELEWGNTGSASWGDTGSAGSSSESHSHGLYAGFLGGAAHTHDWSGDAYYGFGGGDTELASSGGGTTHIHSGAAHTHSTASQVSLSHPRSC